MKGPQPLHFQSAGGGVYVAEEKNSGAELAPAEEFFIPLKFSDREPLGEQENLQPEENDPSFSSGASTLSMPRERAFTARSVGFTECNR